MSYECLYDWKLYLKLGLAGMWFLLFEGVNFELAGILSGLLGAVDVSAMTVNLNMYFLCFLISLGIGVSGNIRVGSYLGKNEPEKAFNAAKIVIFNACNST